MHKIRKLQQQQQQKAKSLAFIYEAHLGFLNSILNVESKHLVREYYNIIKCLLYFD